MKLQIIKYAIQSLRKNKVYTLINIVGLTLGLSVSIALAFTIIGVVNTDRFHKNKESVYKLYYTDKKVLEGSGTISALMAPAVHEEFPEVVDYCQIIGANGMILGSQENYFKEDGLFASEGWFRMLSFPLLYGNPDQALSRINNIVISKKLSAKLFGNINPVGQDINLSDFESDKPVPYMISGVFEDIPITSSLKFDFVIPYDQFLNQNPDVKRWTNFGTVSYLQVLPNTDIRELSKKITGFLQSKRGPTVNPEFFGLAPLIKSSGFIYKLTGEPYIGFFILIGIAIIGFSILFISILNYVNLSIATAIKRSKEIGVKKIVGAGRKELTIQFLAEASLIVIVSGIFASFLHGYIVNIFMDEPQPLSFFLNINMLVFLIGLSIFTIIIAAWYPSVYMSKFSPLKISKTSNDGRFKLSFTRRCIVILQFVSAIFLITTSIILSRQVNFLLNKSIGMDRYGIIYFTKNKQLEQHRDAFTTELKQNPGIESVSYANQLPISIGNATTNIQWEGKDPDVNEYYVLLKAGESFAQTMKIEIVSGRDFISSDSGKVIVNKAAVKRLGLIDPLGKQLTINGSKSEIVAVVKNFNFQMLSSPDRPVFICYNPGGSQIAMVRLTKGQETTGIKSLEVAFRRFSPDFILDYSFMDQAFNENYKSINSMRNVMVIAGYLAIIIACLGLLGLTVHTCERRVKEMAVRKINGAKKSDLVKLLSDPILRSVMVSALIAYPLVFLFNSMILQYFAERIQISLFHFVWSLGILLVSVFMIVGWQILRTANRNPVESLKYQ
jgi:putative ABC transport system permease protein